MSLKVYQRKRKFDETPEPKGKKHKGGKGPLKFVVQMHAATRLHYDLRLEFDGVYKSWAVPKGPSLNPLDQRLAVFVEDHPLEYGGFEGIIPKGNYGAGTVMVWDTGTYVERKSKGRQDSDLAMKKGLEKGHLTFILNGQKLKGEFALIKLKKAEEKTWLLVKKRDAEAKYKDVTKQNLSVKTGRSMEMIAAQAEKAGDIWISNKRRSKPVEKPQPEKEIRKAPDKLDPLPRRIKPQIPVAGKLDPKEKGWLFEPFLDGLRAIAELDGRSVQMHSKSLLPFDKKFPQLIDALKTIKGRMILDGEIVEEKKKAIFWVYDILYYDNKDLRDLSLSERKEILAQAVEDSASIKMVKVIKTPTSAGDVYIGKKIDKSYHSGVSKDWMKVSFSPSSARNTGAKTDEPRLTNLNKIFFPEDKITKGDLIEYYRSVSEYILPHLIDRPESLNRHPNGIDHEGFYQKDLTGYKPRWLRTQRIFSESSDKSIDYFVCQDQRSLLYIVNLGCIEINPWFSRIDSLDKPDFLVIDLDPDDNSFQEVVEVAKYTHKVLDGIGAESFCKTSGATGIHIGVPLKAKYDYDHARKFAEEVCKVVSQKFPTMTSMERNPARRRGKIYLDYMQNRRGQTLAAPYSVRPRPGAPVSTPLKWSELSPSLSPDQFNLNNIMTRLKKVGDLWKPLLERTTDLDKCLGRLKRK